MTLSPLRDRNIGSSEVASLWSLDLHELGEKVYMTRYELWAVKSGLIERPDSDSERLFWGRHLEAGIGAGLAERLGLNVRKVRRYTPHPSVPGMGASLDFEAIGHRLGAGIIETKNVAEAVYRSWPEAPPEVDRDLGDRIGIPTVYQRREPPLRFQLQLQHQLACVPGRSWGILALLIGGNRLVPVPYPRESATIAAIESEVPRFWAQVDSGEPPEIDYSADAAIVGQLYGSVSDTARADLRGDLEATSEIERYLSATAAATAADEIRKEMRARILVRLGEAKRARWDGGTITSWTVAGRGRSVRVDRR